MLHLQEYILLSFIVIIIIIIIVIIIIIIVILSSLLDLENGTLLSLILDRELYLDLVTTELYPRLARALTEGRSLAYVRAAAAKLREAGSMLEALSLLATFTKSRYHTFASYGSFSAAFS